MATLTIRRASRVGNRPIPSSNRCALGTPPSCGIARLRGGSGPRRSARLPRIDDTAALARCLED